MDFDYFTITEVGNKYFKNKYNATFDSELMEVKYQYIGKEQISYSELNRLIDEGLDAGLFSEVDCDVCE